MLPTLTVVGHRHETETGTVLGDVKEHVKRLVEIRKLKACIDETKTHKVTAKPFTGPVPKLNRITPAAKVEMFESRIADQARW